MDRPFCAAMGSQVSPQAVEAAVKRLAQQKPLIQCITNFVSMDLMANVLLAAGASPAMVSPVFLEVGRLRASHRRLIHSVAMSARPNSPNALLDARPAQRQSLRMHNG